MSEQHFQICRFCQRTVKLAYYCEDCGISCCSDCLNEEKIDSYVCQECSSKNIDISDSGKRKVCKDCGNENISQVSQILKSCPKCHSHKIINIYEKKEGLEKGFLDLIKNVRIFVEPLRDVITTLNMLRKKVIDARAPPIRCFHYPSMESDLLSFFKLVMYAKDNLIEKIRNLVQHLSMNRDYFFDIYSQPNSNIRIIEDILENLNRTYSSIQEFINNNVITINSNIDTLVKNLNFIDKITFYFKSYINFLNLAEKEKPVYAIYAKLSNGLNTDDKYRKNKGILFITNFDLSFIHEHGKIKRKKEGIFKAPVKDLTHVKVIGKLFKRLYIEFPYGRYEFSLPPHSIAKVMDYILLARSFDETVIYDKVTAKKLFDIDIDLSDLNNFIEEAINSFFSLKCKYNNYKETSVGVSNSNVGINPPNHIFQPQVQKNSFPQYTGPIPNNLQHYPQILNPSLYQNMGLGQLYTPPYQGNEFFSQNLFDPNRIQNYQPKGFSSPLSNPNLNERNTLMRRLEQAQRQNDPYIFPPNINPYLDKHIVESNFMGVKDIPLYQDYSKNHLTDLFDELKSPIHRKPRIDKATKKRMFELEQERYSLSETLKALDSKFESGNISEIDYFKNFKKLQKEIYMIDKNIENLDEEIRVTREIDRRKYFT